MTAKTEKVLKKLITMSRKLKAQGHDLFVDYSPHIENVSWRLYLGGWEPDKEWDATCNTYESPDPTDTAFATRNLFNFLLINDIRVGE